MIAFLVILPLALIAAAWIAAMVSVRKSTLHLTVEGVVIENHRRPQVIVPIADADHFEPSARAGFLSGVQPATCVLVRRDGSRVVVRATSAPEAGIGIDALNARLATLRTPPTT